MTRDQFIAAMEKRGVPTGWFQGDIADALEVAGLAPWLEDTYDVTDPTPPPAAPEPGGEAEAKRLKQAFNDGMWNSDIEPKTSGNRWDGWLSVAACAAEIEREHTAGLRKEIEDLKLLHTESIEKRQAVESALAAARQEAEAALEECERLLGCLARANSNHEEFERLYYLEKNKVEQLEEDAALASHATPAPPPALDQERLAKALAESKPVSDDCQDYWLERAHAVIAAYGSPALPPKDPTE